MPRRHLFVVPTWRGVFTGGNVYNEGLLAALSRCAFPYERCDLDALDARGAGEPRWLWLDSLYFDQIDSVRTGLHEGDRLGLIAHALPSLLAQASGREAGSLIARERSVLRSIDWALCTSETTRAELHTRAPALPCWVIEPAIRRAPGVQTKTGPINALIVANLTRNKGVLPWLEALATRVRAEDVFSLACVGRFDAEPDYACACRALIEQTPALARRVALMGMLPEPEVLEALACAHILVSASRGESFGMAIANARAAGCIVLARAGGHVAKLVERSAGGALFNDDASLAEAFLALVRDSTVRAQRLAAAERWRLPERSWAQVARELVAYADSEISPRNAQ